MDRNLEKIVDLVAPIYSAAAAYHQPSVLPAEPALANYTIAEMLSVPATRAIIVHYFPDLPEIAESDLKPYITTMTVPGFMAYVPGNHSASFDAADAAIRRVAASDLPRDGQ